MLRQIRTLLAMTPERADFQFDIYPDKRIGDTFAIDICLGLKQSRLQKTSFVNGTCADVMKQLERDGLVRVEMDEQKTMLVQLL